MGQQPLTEDNIYHTTIFPSLSITLVIITYILYNSSFQFVFQKGDNDRD